MLFTCIRFIPRCVMLVLLVFIISALFYIIMFIFGGFYQTIVLSENNKRVAF